MKIRTRQLFVMSAGFPTGVAFISWHAGEDPYQRANEPLTDGDQPLASRQSPQRSWTQAFKHLPKVWKRLVPQSLGRPATKPVGSV